MKFRFVFLSVLGATLCFFAACDDDDPQTSSQASPPSVSDDTLSAMVPATSPALTASPNPVPAGSNTEGTTTIAWNAGAVMGEIYLSMDGTSEKLFARSVKGSQTAPWIATGKTYEFRLYAADDHSKMLAKVTVTRSP